MDRQYQGQHSTSLYHKGIMIFEFVALLIQGRPAAYLTAPSRKLFTLI